MRQSLSAILRSMSEAGLRPFRAGRIGHIKIWRGRHPVRYDVILNDRMYCSLQSRPGDALQPLKLMFIKL